MKKFTITAEEYEFICSKVQSLENENSKLKGYIKGLKEQLGTLVVVGRREQCSGCEESTGETKLWCCNHCGKRIEDF